MQKSLIIVAALVALMGAGYAVYSTQTPEVADTGMTAIQVADEDADSAAAVDTTQIQEMSLGNPDADVTVIEYASFTCPHCANFNATVYKQLKADYIDTGKINFIHREVYFDRYGLWAGLVARCGGEMRYFGLADAIYKTQKEWLASGTPIGISDALKKLGRTAGMSNEQLDACLQDAGKAEALYALYQQQSKADDVTGTPTFIINGQKYSNMNYADFAATLNEKLGE